MYNFLHTQIVSFYPLQDSLSLNTWIIRLPWTITFINVKPSSYVSKGCQPAAAGKGLH